LEIVNIEFDLDNIIGAANEVVLRSHIVGRSKGYIREDHEALQESRVRFQKLREDFVSKYAPKV
jgi:23S rRNA maturation-related 3'-5' exoribonuclease YhaM